MVLGQAMDLGDRLEEIMDNVARRLDRCPMSIGELHHEKDQAWEALQTAADAVRREREKVAEYIQSRLTKALEDAHGGLLAALELSKEQKEKFNKAKTELDTVKAENAALTRDMESLIDDNLKLWERVVQHEAGQNTGVENK